MYGDRSDRKDSITAKYVQRYQWSERFNKGQASVLHLQFNNLK